MKVINYKTIKEDSINKYKAYYDLTKPGIIRGNLLTALAGFFFAANGDIQLTTLVSLIFGIIFLIGAACVVNNYIDREIDSKMKRTKDRALVTGEISASRALLFASVVFCVGLVSLVIGTNYLTVGLGLLAVFMYVVVYGYVKRKSIYGTLVGSIPGAIPPVAGYTAVTNQLDTNALLLFCVLVFWQMPHFYAIAIYRKKEYALAKLPLLPLVKGIYRTRVEIILYIFLFLLSILGLVTIGNASYSFGVIMFAVGSLWLRLAFTKTSSQSVDKWAKKVFGFSLLVLLLFSGTLSLDWLLP